MNIDRFSPLLKRTTLLLSLMAGSVLLSACGGGSDGKSSASSSVSSSSSQRSSFVAASVPANGSGTWPSVKVEAQTPKVLTFQWSAVEGATHYKLYKHDAATGGVVQIGSDLTTTQASDEIGVHVHDWVNNYYYVEACDAAGCQKSDLTFTATEMIKAIGYVKASNGETADFFGWSIAVSADGTTLAVGAPAEDSKAVGANGDQASNESLNSGAVYVFTKANGVWIQQAYLKASNTEQPNENPYLTLPNDRFGYKVALSDDGNTLAVSSLHEDSKSTGINCNQANYETVDTRDSILKAQNYDTGAVYLFTRSGSQWTQDNYVKSIYHASKMRFGESLALSGDGKTLAVGATSDSLATNGVIPYSASSMPACVEFYPSSTSSTSISSSSSSSSSSALNTASSYNGGGNSGAVQIFIRKDDGWMYQALLKNSNAQSADAFGTSIALSTDGNTLAVGAIGEDSNATGVNGDQSINTCYYFANAAYVIDPGCAQVGKRRYQVRGLVDNGAVYVFTRADNVWAQQAYLKPSTTFIQTAFGTSVDLSGDGNTLAVGTPGDASNATGINGDATQHIDYANIGATYVFQRSGTTWSQEAFIKPSTQTRHEGISLVDDGNGGFVISITGGGQFGGSVSLSQDGSILAVGSIRESSNAKGINGDQGDASAARSGAIFVFKRDNSVWSQKSYVKATNTDKEDRFGVSVDLTADGKTMAVGAHREAGRGYTATSSVSSESSAAALDQNDNSADAAGAVYVF